MAKCLKFKRENEPRRENPQNLCLDSKIRGLHEARISKSIT